MNTHYHYYIPDRLFMPEGVSSPSLDGAIISWIPYLLLLIMLYATRNTKISQKYTIAYLSALTALIFADIMEMLWHPMGFGNSIHHIMVIVTMILLVMVVYAYPKAIAIILFGGYMLLLTVTLYIRVYTYSYHYPDSYKKDVAQQIIFIHGTICRLGEGKETIWAAWDCCESPAGANQRIMQYCGYNHIMNIDRISSSVLSIDAVPIVYKPGDFAFHVFPLSSCNSIADGYCITMADRNGKYATIDDRHYHKRYSWDAIKSIYYWMCLHDKW